MLVAQLIVGRLEVIEVDKQQRKRARRAVRTRESGVQAAMQLTRVEEAGQGVGGRLLSAAVIAKGVCKRNRRAV